MWRIWKPTLGNRYKLLHRKKSSVIYTPGSSRCQGTSSPKAKLRRVADNDRSLFQKCAMLAFSSFPPVQSHTVKVPWQVNGRTHDAVRCNAFAAFVQRVSPLPLAIWCMSEVMQDCSRERSTEMDEA